MHRSFLKNLVFTCGLLVSVALCGSELPVVGMRQHLVFLSTTDMHGNILPKNYANGRERQVGLAKLSTMVSQIRSNLDPDQVLLIDCGDTIQGTPLAYYHAKKENTPPDPMMMIMSYMGYDAMTVGNHEYNFGLQVLRKAQTEASFPWLSANTYKAGADQNAYTPYIVKEMKGIRVAVVGITTPGIPAWEDVENYEGLEFRDPLDEARKWVAFVRNEEQADIVVLSVHMGLETNLDSGEISEAAVAWENAAIRLANGVEGVDVMFLGHTHREIPALFVNGVTIAQAGRHADHLARVDVYVDRSDSGLKIAGIESELLPVTEKVLVDPKVVSMAEPYDAGTEAWLNQAVGHSAQELRSEESRFQDTAIIDLVHRVQLEAGRADVSFAASFSDDSKISEGDVTVRDLSGLYVYENTLVVVEVSGRDLKNALEHSALYFRTSNGETDLRKLVSGKIPGYNFDSAEGVGYIIDLKQDAGNRIKNLTFQGKPLNPDQIFRVALNNYRKNGGGNYEMFINAPVVFRSSMTIRDLLIEWVTQHQEIPCEPDNNWSIEF